MTEALQQEIRTLRSLLDSPRDPGGRVFAPLADAYRRAGRVPEALRVLNEGLAKHPDFVTGHVVAARLYVEQGLGAEGAIAARRALELDGENVLALRSLLRVLDESGESESEEVRARLVSLEPDFTPDWLKPGDESQPAAPASWEAPSSPEAPTVPVRALGRQGSVTPVEIPEAEILPTEPVIPADAIDLGSIAPLPAAELPLSALAPDPGPAVAEVDLDLPALVPPDAPVEELLSLEAPAAIGEEPVLELATVAPEPEPVMELATLAPEPEPVMDLATLAPEPVADEPVMELAMLAPEPEPVMELASLAPEEAVLDMAALAPEEDVVSLESLAPEEPVLDMAALAPEEEIVSLESLAPEEPVLDMAALAPEEEFVSLESLAPEEPVLDMAALAPEEDVVSLASLAPEPLAEEPVMDLASLAPAGLVATGVVASLPALEVHPYDEPVFDLDALAPVPMGVEAPHVPPPIASEPPDEAVDITLLTPDAADEIVIDLDALRPEAPVAAPEVPAAAAPVGSLPLAPEPDEEPEDSAPQPETTPPTDEQGEPVYTRTLAELYASQGAVKEAVTVLRRLLADNPADSELASRIAELEAGAPVAAGEPEVEEEEEVETLARDLAESGAGRHDVHSPFAWADEPETEKETGPTIREYFDGLLNWEPREGA